MSENTVSEVRTTQNEPEREQRIFTFKITQLVWLLFGLLEALLALRFVLKLIAANPESPIAAMIYSFTSLFLLPFAGLTGTPSAGGMVLEISTVIAMVIYALIAWGLVKLLTVFFYRPRGPVGSVTQTSTTEHRDSG
jgi:hypothetical protein